MRGFVGLDIYSFGSEGNCIEFPEFLSTMWNSAKIFHLAVGAQFVASVVFQSLLF